MPIYEFYCPANHRIYSFLARSTADAGRVPRCPDNPRWKLERLISPVAVLRRAKQPEPPAEAGAGEDDPRVERALAEMEREFAAVDSDNPDPRMLGRMMRRMAELTGQRMPGAFEEMTRRLEAGEDPDRLEAEFGDALEGIDEAAGADGDLPGERGGSKLRRFLPARRDPTLYELRDYLRESD